jgi:uncharacterized cupredoxin-like copper-binding protein
MRLLVALVASVVAATSALFGAYAIDDAAHAGGDAPLGPGLVTVDVDIRYSKFGFDTLRVRPGTTVRFVVVNRDPIGHEFVVGDTAVHRRHEQGNEAAHPPVPGEVSVPPLETGVTFFSFDAPGHYEFACHLPGHVEFGMIGRVVVETA